MSIYMTGQIARLCEVSVRTVQFYDTSGVLHPSDLSDGGRRLYNDADLTKLRLVCLLRTLGLSLGSITGVLDSDSPSKVLALLLDEQAKHVTEEVKQRQHQLDTIKLIHDSLTTRATIPLAAITDIAHMMESKQQLRKVHGGMLAIGLAMDVIAITTAVVWILTSVWLPFLVGMVCVLALGGLMTRMYHTNTVYLCPECGASFRPGLREFIFSWHTAKTRRLTCTHCGHHGYCVETTPPPDETTSPARG